MRIYSLIYLFIHMLLSTCVMDHRVYSSEIISYAIESMCVYVCVCVCGVCVCVWGGGLGIKITHNKTQPQ